MKDLGWVVGERCRAVNQSEKLWQLLVATWTRPEVAKKKRSNGRAAIHPETPPAVGGLELAFQQVDLLGLPGLRAEPMGDLAPRSDVWEAGGQVEDDTADRLDDSNPDLQETIAQGGDLGPRV